MASVEWQKLTDRATRAESWLQRARQENAARRQQLADLQDVEVSLRREIAQLNRAFPMPLAAGSGIGVKREVVTRAFSNARIVKSDGLLVRGLDRYKIETSAGSIHLWGPEHDLTQIDFFGSLEGEQSESCRQVLALLLASAVPRWRDDQRAAWIAKVAAIEDDLAVFKEIGDVRVSWHWSTRHGARLDVLSIEPR